MHPRYLPKHSAWLLCLHLNLSLHLENAAGMQGALWAPPVGFLIVFTVLVSKHARKARTDMYLGLTRSEIQNEDGVGDEDGVKNFNSRLSFFNCLTEAV